MRVGSVIVLLFVNTSFAIAAEYDSYGGYTGIKRTASGFFRVEQIQDRWYFITPEGHPYIALGGNHVGIFLKNQAEKSGFYKRFDGNREKATTELLKNLRGLGLNAGDAYQPPEIFAKELPWIQPFEYLPQKGEWIDVFDPKQLAAVKDHVTMVARGVAKNPWVLGLAGPDLPVWDSTRVNRFRNASPDSAGRKAYGEFLKKHFGNDIQKVNETFQVQFKTFADLNQVTKLNFAIDSQPAQTADAAFAALVADKLYSTVHRAIQEGAPNHLFLGERTQLRSVPDAVLKAITPHIDVFCTQALIRSSQRPPEWKQFQPDGYDHEYQILKKPMLVVDWAAPFRETDPLDTEHGRIELEKKASDEAAQFVLDSFDRPYMVGLFICMVIGQHQNDLNFFQGQATRAFLRNDGQPYEYRSKRLKEANDTVLKKLYSRLHK